MAVRITTSTGPVLDGCNRPLQVTGPAWRAKRHLGKSGHSACVSLLTGRLIGHARIAPHAPRATPPAPPCAPGLPVTKALPEPLPYDKAAAGRKALLVARRAVMLRRWSAMVELLVTLWLANSAVYH